MPLLACGDVAATYLAAIGFGAVLAGRRSRRAGAVLAFLGVAALRDHHAVHGNIGSGNGLQALRVPGHPGPWPGTQPGRHGEGHPAASAPGARALWAKRLDIWANLAPSGLLGAGFGLAAADW